jgi:hypothetical protein
MTPERDGTRLVYTMVRVTPRNLKGVRFLLWFLLLGLRRPVLQEVTKKGFEALLHRLENLPEAKETPNGTAPTDKAGPSGVNGQWASL